MGMDIFYVEDAPAIKTVLGPVIIVVVESIFGNWLVFALRQIFGHLNGLC